MAWTNHPQGAWIQEKLPKQSARAVKSCLPKLNTWKVALQVARIPENIEMAYAPKVLRTRNPKLPPKVEQHSKFTSKGHAFKKPLKWHMHQSTAHAQPKACSQGRATWKNDPQGAWNQEKLPKCRARAIKSCLLKLKTWKVSPKRVGFKETLKWPTLPKHCARAVKSCLLNSNNIENSPARGMHSRHL
jgi:hypothetical protein